MFNNSVPPHRKKRYVSTANVSLLAAFKRAIVVYTGKWQETGTHCKQKAGFMNVKAQVRVYTTMIQGVTLFASFKTSAVQIHIKFGELVTNTIPCYEFYPQLCGESCSLETAMVHIIINSGWVPCIPLPCWCRQLGPTGSSITTSQAASCCSLWCVSWPPYYEDKGCYMGSNILAEHSGNTTAVLTTHAHTATSKLQTKLRCRPLGSSEITVP